MSASVNSAYVAVIMLLRYAGFGSMVAVPATGALFATVALADTIVPFTLPSFGVTSTVIV